MLAPHVLHPTTHLHTIKSTTEKVIIFVKEISKWVSSSKEVLEYFLSTVHVEVIEIGALLKSEIASTWLSLLCSPLWLP